jgi:hypothetical protein
VTAPFPLYDFLIGNVPNIVLVVRLYQSGPPFTTWPDVSQFTEAAYPGYAQQPFSRSIPNVEFNDGTIVAQVDYQLWQVSSAEGQGCNVAGWYLTSVEPGNVSRVACWGEFKPAQPMLKKGDTIETNILFSCNKWTTPAAN